jgi:hypothetical protein
MAVQCQQVVSYLSDYIDNNLSGELAQDIRDHVATCKNCHIVLDSTQKTIILFHARGKQVGMPPGRSATLFAQLSEALAARTEDDCE